MARLSDIIEKFIKEMINESEKEQVQIQRNELADQFKCAPSQINYVLTTRFTYDKGYVIESRRGGGGHIIIRQISCQDESDRKQIIYDAIGDSITYNGAISLLENLYNLEVISKREFAIMKISLNDRTLINVEDKNKVRADIMKAMIIELL